MATAISQWFDALTSLLAELKQKDFGFPIGNNRMLPARGAGDAERVLHDIGLHLDVSVVEFYTHCDGISLPGIQNGYFIHSLEKLTSAKPPHHITGSYAADVVIIGSTGGGQLFALRKGLWDVAFLPHSLVKNGIYDGTAVPVRIVADNFTAFLDHLLADVQAFVRGARNHQFVA